MGQLGVRGCGMHAHLMDGEKNCKSKQINPMLLLQRRSTTCACSSIRAQACAYTSHLLNQHKSQYPPTPHKYNTQHTTTQHHTALHHRHSLRHHVHTPANTPRATSRGRSRDPHAKQPQPLLGREPKMRLAVCTHELLPRVRLRPSTTSACASVLHAHHPSIASVRWWPFATVVDIFV